MANETRDDRDREDRMLDAAIEDARAEVEAHRPFETEGEPDTSTPPHGDPLRDTVQEE